jgi:hypothetical protein
MFCPFMTLQPKQLNDQEPCAHSAFAAMDHMSCIKHTVLVRLGCLRKFVRCRQSICDSKARSGHDEHQCPVLYLYSTWLKGSLSAAPLIPLRRIPLRGLD